MRLTQTKDGKTIVQRKTRNGSYQPIGELNTKLSLKEAKAAYTSQLEDIEQVFNGQQNAVHSMRLAVKGLNLYVESTERTNA